VHDAEDVLHGPVLAHDVAHAEPLPQLLPQHPVLAHQVAALHGPAQDDQDLVLLQRLGQVVEGPLLHGVHGAVDRPVRGHERHTQTRLRGQELRQQVDAVHVRHLEVGEHHVERL
jgi:hypothetical protein